MNTTYVAWLNDARAMELGLIQTIESHLRLLEDHPAMKTRMEQHLAETRRHAEIVEECIKQYGGKVAMFKGMLSTLAGGLGGAAAAVTGDDLMKAMLSDSAAEELEIASYTALIASARELGDNYTADACEEILKDEVAHQEWIRGQLPALAHKYLSEDS